MMAGLFLFRLGWILPGPWADISTGLLLKFFAELRCMFHHLQLHPVKMIPRLNSMVLLPNDPPLVSLRQRHSCLRFLCMLTCGMCMQCLIHRRNNMASIIFAGLGLLCSALYLMAANEDVITRIGKTNVYSYHSQYSFTSKILCYLHLHLWLTLGSIALVVPSDTEMDKARRFLCFGICVYCWQNGSLVLVVPIHLNIWYWNGQRPEVTEEKNPKYLWNNSCWYGSRVPSRWAYCCCICVNWSFLPCSLVVQVNSLLPLFSADCYKFMEILLSALGE